MTLLYFTFNFFFNLPFLMTIENEIGHFEILHKCSKTNARVSTFKLKNSTVKLPTFMPVATKASMKGVLNKYLNEEIILSNTYHCRDLKHSLKEFMSYGKSMLTDSGGFQIVSLKDSKVIEEGVYFYDNNKEILLTPEDSMNIQNTLGADIIMQLDDVVNPLVSFERINEAMYRSIRWFSRCIKANKNCDQLLFPIVQGGLYEDLRLISINNIFTNNIKGIAIGGLSGGENKEDFIRIVDFCIKNLAINIPKYVMGVGYPEDLVCIFALGADMADCVYPTRTARFSRVFTDYGDLNLNKDIFKFKLGKIDEECECYTCLIHTLAYLHSIKGTTNLYSLLSIHNIYYMRNLTIRIKRSIANNNFDVFVKMWSKKRFAGNAPVWFKNTISRFNIEV